MEIRFKAKGAKSAPFDVEIERNKAENESPEDAVVRWIDDGGQRQLSRRFRAAFLDVFAWDFKNKRWVLIMDLKRVLL